MNSIFKIQDSKGRAYFLSSSVKDIKAITRAGISRPGMFFLEF
jgi:hypothetical protein